MIRMNMSSIRKRYRDVVNGGLRLSVVLGWIVSRSIKVVKCFFTRIGGSLNCILDLWLIHFSVLTWLIGFQAAARRVVPWLTTRIALFKQFVRNWFIFVCVKIILILTSRTLVRQTSSFHWQRFIWKIVTECMIFVVFGFFRFKFFRKTFEGMFGGHFGLFPVFFCSGAGWTCIGIQGRNGRPPGTHRRSTARIQCWNTCWWAKLFHLN